MVAKPLRLVLISTPLGFVGSGRGGGVELTLISIVKGLLEIGHEVVLVAPEGSALPPDCQKAEIITVNGKEQAGWQHQNFYAPMTIPLDGILPKLLEKALEIAESSDAILNLCYDWLPLWITPYVKPKIFHLISMGAVSKLMQSTINHLAKSHHSRLGFHTNRQASDFHLTGEPIVLGNGFDLKKYNFRLVKDGPLGWAGRIAPEKGLEDAVKVAASLGDTLLVWGIVDDEKYAAKIDASVPSGTIQWRGFLNTHNFQEELGTCRAFINTPKWNEAYGNVVMEAMACGVPVVAYDRGGPGELVKQGVTGWLVPPDDINQLKEAVSKVADIERTNCRDWAIDSASYEAFGKRIHFWITNGIKA